MAHRGEAERGALAGDGGADDQIDRLIGEDLTRIAANDMVYVAAWRVSPPRAPLRQL
jgi:hypothetical protein